MSTVLVSACLLGWRCRYDGKGYKPSKKLVGDMAGHLIVPFCAEAAGGLAIPRPPASMNAAAAAILDGHGSIATNHGVDVTDAFMRGAEMALAVVQRFHIKAAFLKENSPSCGVSRTNIQFQRTAGPGIMTCALSRFGVHCRGYDAE